MREADEGLVVGVIAIIENTDLAPLPDDCSEDFGDSMRHALLWQRDEIERLQMDTGRLSSIVQELHELREHSPCFYDDDGDCGNWDNCSLECPIRGLREMTGYEPRKDGRLGKPGSEIKTRKENDHGDGDESEKG